MNCVEYKGEINICLALLHGKHLFCYCFSYTSRRRRCKLPLPIDFPNLKIILRLVFLDNDFSPNARMKTRQTPSPTIKTILEILLLLGTKFGFRLPMLFTNHIFHPLISIRSYTTGRYLQSSIQWK